MKHRLALLLAAPLFAIAATASSAEIDVMTQNQYVGTDLIGLVTADDFNAAVVAALEEVETVGLEVWPDRGLLWDAVAIALRRGCSVYDSLYLALADKIDGRLVTADRRLVNALTGTEAAGRLVWIEDLAPGGAPPRH